VLRTVGGQPAARGSPAARPCAVLAAFCNALDNEDEFDEADAIAAGRRGGDAEPMPNLATEVTARLCYKLVLIHSRCKSTACKILHNCTDKLGHHTARCPTTTHMSAAVRRRLPPQRPTPWTLSRRLRCALPRPQWPRRAPQSPLLSWPPRGRRHGAPRRALASRPRATTRRSARAASSASACALLRTRRRSRLSARV